MYSTRVVQTRRHNLSSRQAICNQITRLSIRCVFNTRAICAPSDKSIQPLQEAPTHAHKVMLLTSLGFCSHKDPSTGQWKPRWNPRGHDAHNANDDKNNQKQPPLPKCLSTRRTITPSAPQGGHHARPHHPHPTAAHHLPPASHTCHKQSRLRHHPSHPTLPFVSFCPPCPPGQGGTATRAVFVLRARRQDALALSCAVGPRNSIRGVPGDASFTVLPAC